jgi:hypothetical protein
MNHARLIYDDTPEFIPVPNELRHRKIEVIFLPLDDNTDIQTSGEQLVTPPTQGFNCNGEPVIAGQQHFPDLSAFRAKFPKQEISAGEFCRQMRDEDRY